MANQATIRTSRQVPGHHPSCSGPSMAPATDIWGPCSARDKPEASGLPLWCPIFLVLEQSGTTRAVYPQLPSCGRGWRDQTQPQKDNICCSLLCSLCGVWGPREDTTWGQTWALRLAYTDPKHTACALDKASGPSLLELPIALQPSETGKG